MIRVLIIDDELSKTDESRGFERKFTVPGVDFIFARDRQQALRTLAEDKTIGLVLLDIIFENMTEEDGLQRLKSISKEIWPAQNESLAGNEYGLPLLETLRAAYPEIPVVMLSSKRVPNVLLWCWKHGASYYVMKPADDRESLAKDIRGFARYIAKDPIIGESQIVLRLREQIGLAAQSGSAVSVLITGESGTGKELVARAIHQNGSRKDAPFVVVNCAAIPSNLIESELFGHRKGSFTGAIADKRGKLQEADGGVLFLDEIGELPLELQSKLLRAINRGMRFSPVGSVEEITCDIQVVAATNKDLGIEMREQRFREDLFYRLNVFPIETPPLRQHPEDIPSLLDHFLDELRSLRYRAKSGITGFSEDAIAIMQAYHWPGNVRQLENAVEYAIIRTVSGLIGPHSLPPAISSTPGGSVPLLPKLGDGFNLRTYCARVQWNILRRAYQTAISENRPGLIERIAQLAGISNPSDIHRTLLPSIKDLCPDLVTEIDSLLPAKKRPRQPDSV